MKITSKLLLIAIIFFLEVAIFSTALNFLIQSFNNAIEKNTVANNIVTYAFQRRLVLDEYLLYELDRSKGQWLTISISLKNYLQSRASKFFGPEEKTLINNLIEDTAAHEKIFFQFVAINENENNRETENIKRDQKTRLTNQLLVKAEDIIFATNQLAKMSLEEASVAQRNIGILLIIFIINLTVIITGIILFLWKSVARPMMKLQKGTKIIASGNLDYQVEIKGKDEVGKLASSFNSMTSKLKEIMEESAQELQKFRLAFDNASDHIIITNSEGVILYANKGAENTTGYAQKEMIGKKPSLWGKHMSKEFYENMWKTIKIGKKEFIGDVTNLKKNGQEYQAQLKIAPVFDHSGNIKLFVGIERDVTREKKIDRAKTEFVALASHQLRTPLTAVRWYTKILLMGNAGALNEKQQKYIDEIYHGNQRMVDLVDALLNVSRLELGTFVFEPESTDIVKLVQSVIEEQKPQMDEKKIQFFASFGKNIPSIQIDPKLLRMVMQNLLSNAIKYTAAEGKIETKLSLDRQRKNILFQISDTGFGIPKNQQDKIFTKLFRADNVKEKDTQGTGLGLYIAKSIIDHAGGKIWFESEERQGTTFFVQLPY